MSRFLIVRLYGRPPGTNDIHRMSRWEVTKSRGEWRDAAYCEAKAAVSAANAVPFGIVTIGVEWRCRTKRRRDFDNLVGGLKPLFDGLVAAGVIIDDSSDIVVALGPLRVQVGCERDETVLTVTEAEVFDDGNGGRLLRLPAQQWEMG